jgi:hypothetical protein
MHKRCEVDELVLGTESSNPDAVAERRLTSEFAMPVGVLQMKSKRETK